MNILDTRENLNAMVLLHDQQIKDIAAHLLELKKLVTPMMEFKRSGWVGLTKGERNVITDKVIGFNSCVGWEDNYAKAIEAALKDKNGG